MGENVDQLERSIFASVAATLSLPSTAQIDDEGLQRLRTALFSSSLTGPEREILASSPERDREQVVNQLLTARLQRVVDEAARLLTQEEGAVFAGPAFSIRAEPPSRKARASRPETLILELHHLDSAAIDPEIPDAAGAAVRSFDAVTIRAPREELERLAQQLRRAVEKDGVKPSAPEPDRLLGTLLSNKYRIKQRIGKGGFGTVYEAIDEALGVSVAVKILNPDVAQEEFALKAFFEEAKVLTAFDHPNIVRWITFDRTEDGLHYFVMELLSGVELHELLKQSGSRLPARRAQRVLLQVLDALRSAHERDLLHLDLKPQNVFVMTTAGKDDVRVKVIDFGISQHVGPEAGALRDPSPSLLDGETDLTRSISVTVTVQQQRADGTAGVARARGGTPLYASPEQCRHLALERDIVPLDGRSDIYSFGIMAFQVLTGRFPFEMPKTRTQAIKNHLEVEPRKVGTCGVRIPRKLAAFVDKCLVKDRDRRWRDTDEAYAALQRIVQPPPPVGLMLAGAASLVGAVLLASYLMREEPVIPTSLLAVEDGVETTAETELYFGEEPKRLRLPLGTRERLPDLATLQPRIAAQKEGETVEGWNARWVDYGMGTLEIEARDPGVPSLSAFLEFARRGRTSAPLARAALDLIHLAPPVLQAPEIVSFDPELELDPDLQTLRVDVVAGPVTANALEEPDAYYYVGALEPGTERASEAEAPRLGRPQAVPTTDGRLSYQWRLDSIPNGGRETCHLWVEVRDRSGRKQRSPVLPVRLSGPPSSVETQNRFLRDQTAIAKTNGLYIVYPRDTLRIVVDRPTEVSIELSDNAGSLQLEPWSERVEKERTLTFDDLLPDDVPSFEGLLKISTDDTPYVDRAYDVQQSSSTESIKYFPTAPAVEVRALTLPDAGTLRPGETTFLRAPDLSIDIQLALRTDTNRELWVEAWCSREEQALGDGSNEHVVLSRNADRLRSTVACAEGAQFLHVQSFDSSGGKKGNPVGPKTSFPVHVDNQSPTVAVEGAGSGSDGVRPWITRERRGSLRVGIQDVGGALQDATWALLPPGGGETPLFERALELDGDGAVSLVDWFPPELADTTREDGEYRLVLSARDRAGNLQRTEVVLPIAYAGPTVRLSAPRDFQGRWEVRTNSPWVITASITDPNEIRSATARVSNAEREVEFSLAMVETAPGIWKATSDDFVDYRWSGQNATVTVDAIDEAGNKSAVDASSSRMLPMPLDMEPQLPERIRTPEGAMVLQRSNPDTYISGGRASEARYKGVRPWNIQVPNGRVRPYYIDVREVSVADFLDFVEQDYMSPEHWPWGAAPDEKRRASLLDAEWPELDRPVTGMTQAEAAAYAHAHGKRLPTLLEWEFAVRSGRDYNEFPDEPEPPAATDGDCALSTPLSLSSGVLEWTASPVRFTVDRLTSPDAHYLDHTAWFIDPPEVVWRTAAGEFLGLNRWSASPFGPRVGEPALDAASDPRLLVPRASYAVHEDASERTFLEDGQFWIVGAAPRSEEVAYDRRSVAGAGTCRADVGFRCVVDAYAAYHRLGTRYETCP